VRFIQRIECVQKPTSNEREGGSIGHRFFTCNRDVVGFSHASDELTIERLGGRELFEQTFAHQHALDEF
jgi:hypothetical protein